METLTITHSDGSLEHIDISHCSLTLEHNATHKQVVVTHHTTGVSTSTNLSSAVSVALHAAPVTKAAPVVKTAPAKKVGVVARVRKAVKKAVKSVGG
jgi:hypothetical protein